MAFWGVEVKPGKSHSLRFDDTSTGGRLHLSKATLGIGKSSRNSYVQCIVGDKSPVLLCCLKPDQTESCSLHIEFAEYDEVVFSVLGKRSVHLAGYFVDRGANFDAGGDDLDSYGEDIGDTESENSSDYDYGSDEYDDGFIQDDSDDDDDEEDNEDEDEDDDSDEFDFIGDDDIEMFSPSKKPKTGVVIEEILDDEKLANESADNKGAAKKYQAIDSDGDNQKQMIVTGGSSIFESESEDEDGLPISSQSKAKDESIGIPKKHEKKVSNKSKKAENVGSDQVVGTKRKNEDRQDGKTERLIENPSNSLLPSSEVGRENADKPKKKKKKDKTKVTETSDIRNNSRTDTHQEDEAQLVKTKTDDIMQEPVENGAYEKPSTDKSVVTVSDNDAGEDIGEKKKKKKKKKKNKKNETSESDKNANTEEPKKESVVEIEDKNAEMKPKQERSYSNGLVVEELEMGKPDGRRASPGNKVSVCYIGKLQKNGKIFDSSINKKAPFQFRLGVGQVIKGWDVGLNGMRVGDKRRLTIPPSMGYGSKKTGPIPPNAWLVFDVELIAVG